MQPSTAGLIPLTFRFDTNYFHPGIPVTVKTYKKTATSNLRKHLHTNHGVIKECTADMLTILTFIKLRGGESAKYGQVEISVSLEMVSTGIYDVIRLVPVADHEPDE